MCVCVCITAISRLLIPFLFSLQKNLFYIFYFCFDPIENDEVRTAQLNLPSRISILQRRIFLFFFFFFFYSFSKKIYVHRRKYNSNSPFIQSALIISHPPLSSHISSPLDFSSFDSRADDITPFLPSHSHLCINIFNHDNILNSILKSPF